jgi:hypothetical protein
MLTVPFLKGGKVTRRTIIMAVIFVVVGLAGGKVRAAIIEIGITAEIAEIDDPYGLLNGQLGVDDILGGRYIYDSSTPDSSTLATFGSYEHYSQPYGINLSGGGFVFRTNPDNVYFHVGISNDHAGVDNYAISSWNNLGLYGDVYVSEINWQLDDSSGTALSSDTLPTTAPALGDWNLDWGIRIDGGIPDEYGKFIESFHIRAPVTSVEVIPEPGTVFLLGLGGLVLLRIRSRK